MSLNISPDFRSSTGTIYIQSSDFANTPISVFDPTNLAFIQILLRLSHYELWYVFVTLEKKFRKKVIFHPKILPPKWWILLKIRCFYAYFLGSNSCNSWKKIIPLQKKSNFMRDHLFGACRYDLSPKLKSNIFWWLCEAFIGRYTLKFMV